MTFGLARQEKVRLRIFDIQGRCVRQLIDEVLPAGKHRIPWDGMSDEGHRVGSGVFFTQLVYADQRTIRKLSVIK